MATFKIVGDVVTKIEEQEADPMHIDVKDLTFGYVGREVNGLPIAISF
jgi:pentose-5-phosphate-3-epimerase